MSNEERMEPGGWSPQENLEHRKPFSARAGSTGTVDSEPWKHRSQGMRCRTCMWFAEKAGYEPMDGRGSFGRCRRHAPTMSGYPAVFGKDWCGDHKLDETKIFGGVGMRKIIETCGEVKDALAAAAEMEFVEVMVVGKSKNGDYYLRKSDHASSLESVGVLEMAKQWLLGQIKWGSRG